MLRKLFFLLLFLMLHFAHAAPQELTQHFPYGAIQKALIAPDMEITMQNGEKSNLRVLLNNKITALQLIFTGCSATCPIQGALFDKVANQINQPEIQLLSISIDVMHDNPNKLKTWMQHYRPYKFWNAGVPSLTNVEILFDYLNGKSDSVDNHTAQVYLFNQDAELIYKTDEMPSAKTIVDLLNKIQTLNKGKLQN